MPKLPVRDIEVNYREEGTGFPLVLIHGLNGDSSGWVQVMSEFAGRYRVIAPDVRGHGSSGKPDAPYSIPQFSEDLFAFLQELRVPKAHVLGLSMGGAIAQQFALDHPEKVRCLLLVSTFSYVDAHLREAFGRLRQSLERGGYPAFFDEVVKLAFTPGFVSANAQSIAELKEKRIQINSPVAIGRATDACLAFDLRDEISRISHPTLILSGREDVFTPIHLSEQIHRSIRGSEWRILEGVGHNLYIEKPTEMAQQVLRFLARHDGAAVEGSAKQSNPETRG
ncbi:MAG: alpha/beta hydrolase [candidate division NC10 bacterium]|nr:alpha/beta hydrolase [candidate division NC10 bacterium]